MDVLMELGSDVARLWATYAPTYLNGVKNTLILAVVATFFGCVIGLLCGAPNGIQAMCADMPGLVQTSLNLGVAKLGKENFSMTFSVRSSVNEEKVSLLEKLEKL